MKTVIETKVVPLEGSKFHFRIRVFGTKRDMEKQAVADGAMTGYAQAAFHGFERHEVGPGNRIGEVYLHTSDTLRSDVIHELTHAAVHYVREIRGGDLSEPNRGEYASEAEELLCRVQECLLTAFFP